MNSIKLDEKFTFQFSPPLLICVTDEGRKRVSPLVRAKKGGWKSFFGDSIDNRILSIYRDRMEEAYGLHIERKIVE